MPEKKTLDQTAVLLRYGTEGVLCSKNAHVDTRILLDGPTHWTFGLTFGSSGLLGGRLFCPVLILLLAGGSR
jgi:hypothetical protein